jgi:tetratricopeptide (TPR) repeat protein
MNRRTVSLLLIAAVCGSPAFAQPAEDVSPEAILEATTNDPGFSDQTVIDRCSIVLRKNNDKKNSSVQRALALRSCAYANIGMLQEALKDADDLCVILPQDGLAHLTRANILRASNRLDEAIEEAKRAIELSPTEPTAHCLLAFCCLNQKQSKKCIASAKRAAELDPLCAPAYYLIGLAIADRHPASCLEAMNKYLELEPLPPSPDSDVPYFWKGLSLALLNRPKEALPSLMMAQKLKPSAETAREISFIHSDAGRCNLALHYANECIRLDPAYAVGPCLAAKNLQRLGKQKEAVEMAKRLVEMKDATPWMRADVHHALGDFAEAIRYYDKDLDEKPWHSEALVGKATLLASCPDERFRDGKDAIRLASKALDRKGIQEWQKWEPTMALAEAYAETGNFELAAIHAQNALDLAGPQFGRRGEFEAKLALFLKGRPYRSKAE